jgi:hypothetical protein
VCKGFEDAANAIALAVKQAARMAETRDNERFLQQIILIVKFFESHKEVLCDL